MPFCAAERVETAGILSRRSALDLGGRRYPQHRLPSSAPLTFQSGQRASVLAIVTAPGTALTRVIRTLD